VKVDTYVAANISIRGIDNLMESPAAEEPPSVVGRVLDPAPASECQHEWLTRTRDKMGNETVWRINIEYLMEQNLEIQLLLLLVVKQPLQMEKKCQVSRRFFIKIDYGYLIDYIVFILSYSLPPYTILCHVMAGVNIVSLCLNIHTQFDTCLTRESSFCFLFCVLCKEIGIVVLLTIVTLTGGRGLNLASSRQGQCLSLVDVDTQ